MHTCTLHVSRTYMGARAHTPTPVCTYELPVPGGFRDPGAPSSSCGDLECLRYYFPDVQLERRDAPWAPGPQLSGGGGPRARTG